MFRSLNSTTWCRRLQYGRLAEDLRHRVVWVVSAVFQFFIEYSHGNSLYLGQALTISPVRRWAIGPPSWASVRVSSLTILFTKKRRCIWSKSCLYLLATIIEERTASQAYQDHLRSNRANNDNVAINISSDKTGLDASSESKYGWTSDDELTGNTQQQHHQSKITVQDDQWTRQRLDFQVA